ncbi:MAG: AAA family ATPase [Acidobacteria bacterium]|nr:AAA family ATPase [Acidobacteriota bacterium]
MYKTFYNLKLNPFEITPDPSFLFSTSRHNEALASLYYGVRARKGFVVLTGEVGTGKTMLVRCVLELLRRTGVAFAYVFNPSLSALEFIRYIASDFGLPVAGKAKDELVLSLSSFLVERHQRKLSTLLVVDEAHHLSPELLEEVRLLTNLETTQQKLLQIVLAGQPELDEMLDSFELRQIKQRIALRCHLEPLNLEETRGYVQRRLQIAGVAPDTTIFSEASVSAIFKHSNGFPRLINTICENALLSGYGRRAAVIPGEIIDEIAQDLRLGVVVTRGEKKNSAASATKEAKEQEKDELLRAVKTLLELHDYLQDMKTAEKAKEEAVVIRRPY